MSLQYHLVERKVVSGQDQGKMKTYAQVRTGKKISFDKLCTKLSSFCTATPGDVALVIKNMLILTAEYLEEGNVVQMGDLGNFRMSAGSQGVEDPEDFSVSCFNRPKVVFTPGKILNQVRDNMQFEKMNAVTVKELVECTEPHA